MGIFDNATQVMINNKVVKRIELVGGGVLYESVVPASLSVSKLYDTVSLNGSPNTNILTATVLDANLSPCENVEVVFSVNGSDTSVLTDGNGVANYTYTAQSVSGTGEVSVVVSCGSLVETCNFYDVLYYDNNPFAISKTTTNEGCVAYQIPCEYTDNVKITAKIVPTQANLSKDCVFSLGLVNMILENQLDSISSFNAVMLMQMSHEARCGTYINGVHHALNQSQTGYSLNTTYALELTIENTNLFGRILNIDNDTVMYQNSFSYSHTINPKKYAIQLYANSGVTMSVTVTDLKIVEL